MLAVDATADIVAIGDFNDHPTDEGIRTALGTVATAAEAIGGKLLNTSYSTAPDATNSTYVYKTSGRSSIKSSCRQGCSRRPDSVGRKGRASHCL
jgi:hypothetical protein